MKVDMVKPLKRRQPHMPRSTFISKSQARKKARADSMLVDQSIKESEAMMRVSEMLARSENAVMNALCLTTAPSRQGRMREYGSKLSSGRRRPGTSAKCDGQWVRCQCGATRNVSHLSHYRIRRVAS